MTRERDRIVVSLPSWERHGMSRQLHDSGFGYTAMKDAFSHLIGMAEEVLSICSPFADYEGLQPFVQDFHDALQRNVSIRLLTRITPSRSDGLRLRGLGRFLDEMNDRHSGNIEIRSYHYSDESGLHSGIHAKLIIADRDVCYIGSGEFRTYSYNKNLEVGVILHGKPASQLAVLFDYLYDRSQPLSIGED